jgi:hypothetical protein
MKVVAGIVDKYLADVESVCLWVEKCDLRKHGFLRVTHHPHNKGKESCA